ncbi:sigma-70 family RNA polymerase sigma factor [Pseudobacter ginsenosidimutans]|uniref:RNA polymerase sigma-70 factor (ECF subfamily) n=1 Tax=Pseudobacter ginsenosidimutans TaxID=661488 RepID=A0A4Q7N5B9_9BACT|nr:sigma-70 family RNA polymerase sigma factor [Pseudobacter ginsenosidimutans]QEC44769.1 sigma-70 family RNA polymerase sigma factor [Pseudobacter ginsenosidimutans]RZS76253.1 RNA polymerase sigma-70 factor (ECF subfamily) [Pseudobacter ginsenosidimutans]
MSGKTDIFLEYRSLLFSIAYNMLGSVDAAEDLVQDSYLKWMASEETDIRFVKSYLVKTVTNLCINYLNSARIRRESYVGIWLPEPLHQSDKRSASAGIESWHALSIGILVLLEKLTPQERAIFLLKEIFAYDYFELAQIFDKTEQNCRQIFKRAKDHLGNDTRRFDVDLKVHEKVLNNFLQALTDGQMDELIHLLKEDIILYADGGGSVLNANGRRFTAALKPVYGKEHVSRLLVSVVLKMRQYVPAFSQQLIMANGLPSILTNSGDEPLSLISIEPEGDRIRNIYLQTNPEKLHSFRKI